MSEHGSLGLSRARAERAVRGAFAATLCLEALTVLFVPRAIAKVGPALTPLRLTLLLVLAAALLVTAFVQNRRVGLPIGTALQVGLLATGLLQPTMVILAVVYGLVWWYLIRLRRTVLAQRAGTTPSPGPAGSDH